MNKIMTVPRAKKQIIYAEKYLLPEKISFCSADQEKTAKLLKLFIPSLDPVYSEDGIIDIKSCEFEAEGSYTLTVKNKKITVCCGDYEGIRNALATLSNLLVYEDGKPLLCGCEISDYPSCGHRGIMLDLARGTENIEKLKSDLVLIAKAKMNYLHLHLFDSRGVCFRMQSLPESCCIKNAYTKEEILELVELCDILSLEVIPEFDMPAHSTMLVENRRELMCDTGLDNPSKWVVCAGSEEVYAFYEDVIQELVDIFPGKYIHVGGDELENACKPESNILCHWDICRRCRSYMEKHKIENRRELYYHFMLRIYDIVKKHNRQMIIWSDQIDTEYDIPLPRDIIFHFWRVAKPGRGPYINCSMNQQLKAGYKIINSHYPDTYVHIEDYTTSARLKDWLWDNSPESDPALKGNIIGSELCAWEYGNKEERYAHYAYSLPSEIVLMGDKLWNKDVLPYSSEYEEAVTKSVLGPEIPCGLNVFKCLGDLIPPRSPQKAHVEKITCDREYLEATAAKLDALKNNQRAEIYKDCILYALSAMEGA